MKKIFIFLMSFCVIHSVVYAEGKPQPVNLPDRLAEGSKVVYPRKVEVDKNFDGKVDLREEYNGAMIMNREEDSDLDGTIDSWTHFNEAGNPTETEKDTNHDGKPDTWVHY